MGGDSGRLVEQLDAKVLGVDSSVDMVELARERNSGVNAAKLRFRCADIRQVAEYADQPFDLMWSRDCGAYLTAREKSEMWAALRRSNDAPFRILVTDYVLGEGAVSEEFLRRMRSWGQNMTSVRDYVELFEMAGFKEVRSLDWTADLLASMKSGLELLEAGKEQLLELMSPAEHEALGTRWRQKIQQCEAGELMWAIFTAHSDDHD
jgi:phosphoethanolamine N-methyltransferase